MYLSKPQLSLNEVTWTLGVFTRHARYEDLEGKLGRMKNLQRLKFCFKKTGVLKLPLIVYTVYSGKG